MPLDPPSAPSTFEAIWININGINTNKANANFSLLVRSFLRSKYSMPFIQEPRLKDEKADTLDKACNWPNSKVQGWFTSNQRGNGGVATIAKKSFLNLTNNFLVVELADDECQHISFSVGPTQFSFANVHMDSHSGAELEGHPVQHSTTNTP